jgi:hypothetical protein
MILVKLKRGQSCHQKLIRQLVVQRVPGLNRSRKRGLPALKSQRKSIRQVSLSLMVTEAATIRKQLLLSITLHLVIPMLCNR